MTRQLIGDCPTCKVMVIATEVQHMVYTDGGDSAPDWRFSLLACEHCHYPFVVYEENDDRADLFDDPIWLHPAPPTSEREEIPSGLRTAMREARACVAIGAYSAAVVMAGRVIEGVAQEYGVKKNNLYKALEELASREVVDGRFVEWLGHLRGLRNHAAHFSGKPSSRQDAEDSIALADALLTYLFLFRTRFDAYMKRDVR